MFGARRCKCESCLRRNRQAEEQRSPLLRTALRPRSAAVAANDAMYDRQPNARSRELRLCMHPLEDSEEFVRVLHVKAHTVVPDEIDLLVVLHKVADLNACGIARGGKLEGVGEEIRPHLL